MLEQWQTIFGNMLTIALGNLRILRNMTLGSIYFINELVQNLGYKNILLKHWAQLFQENLGTGRLA